MNELSEDDELIIIIADIRELIFNDYPESQSGMVGSPIEVLLCAKDWITKRARNNIVRTRKCQYTKTVN